MEMTAGSLCAGIGGFEWKTPSGVKFLWANEMESHVCDTYEINHDVELYRGLMEDNIHKFTKVDLITAGFPCQPFSIAGKRLGFDDLRGQVIFNIVELVDKLRPSFVVLENVKNLVNEKFGEWLKTILQKFKDMGYDNTWEILDTAKVTEIPQHRERVYIILSQKYDLQEFNFPKHNIKGKTIPDMLQKNGNFKYYERGHRIGDALYSLEDPREDTVYQWRRKYVRENKNKQCPTLTKNMGTGGNNIPIVYNNGKFRELTIDEVLSFQGLDGLKFPDNLKSKGKKYAMVGNAVTSDVANLVISEVYRLYSNRIFKTKCQ